MIKVKSALCLPEIPKTWLIAALLVAMCVMRMYGMDSYTTASISAISGYLLGVKMEQVRQNEP